jgi:hypothetical protein
VKTEEKINYPLPFKHVRGMLIVKGVSIIPAIGVFGGKTLCFITSAIDMLNEIFT